MLDTIESEEVKQTPEEKEQAQLAAQDKQRQRRLADMKDKQAARLRYEEVQAMPEEARNIYAAHVQVTLDPATIARQAEQTARAEVEAKREAEDTAEMEQEIRAIRAKFGDVSIQRFEEVRMKYAQRKAERATQDTDRKILAEEYDSPISRAVQSLDKEGQKIFFREVEAMTSKADDIHTEAAAVAEAGLQSNLYSQYIAEAQDLAASNRRYAIPKLRAEFKKRGLNI